ncbi:MAG: serine/threonine protein kinase [Deltaproteobacteria bacterium RBG_16_71_12]|nr:MAG: serine/threonine protein kinase [Deltaproteobacteria bacterium RBG_16_71_12]
MEIGVDARIHREKPSPIQVASAGMSRGTRFGKYTLLNRIAVGGMAEIFLARQEGLEGFEKTICIKRIRPHLSSQPNFVRMFLNEAKLAAQLNHPNIVQIYDLGRIADSYFIAMEYISGRDMSRIMPKADKQGIPFPMIYALRIASNVCEGLYYAHTKTDAYGNPLHVVHRDVTPENVLVGFNGTVKIVDFGIAKANTQIEQTRAGEIKGKLSYMSPEQAMGHQLDARSDIFALGSVIYEWVTGYKLFTGENEMAILKSIIDGKIYPPSYFKEDVPEAVERILMKALEKDKEKRYQTAWEMQFDIDTYLASSEFTPSNIHLSNFLKQIFGDEIEREKEILLKNREAEDSEKAAAAAAGQSAHEHDEEVLELEDVGGRALTDASMSANGNGGHVRGTIPGRPASKGDGELRLRLSSAELEALRRIAEAHKTTVDHVAREMLKNQLKWS